MTRFWSLLWLRWQYLMSNKLFLVLVCLPVISLLMVVSADGSVTDKGIAFLGVGMNSIYSLTAGTFVCTMIAEEKEKKNLKTLILSGVNQSEYIFSVILFPILLSIVTSISIPLLLQIDDMDWTKFLVVITLTIIIFVLLNLLIAFLTKSQIQATIFSFGLYLLMNVIPVFSEQVKWIKKVVEYSFIGANNAYFSKVATGETFKLTDPTMYSLLAWILVVGIALYFAYQYNRKIV